MNIKIHLILFFIVLSSLAYSQNQITKKKINLMTKKKVTFYWIGRACPPFVNTESKYGFKLECKGCILTRKIKKQNRKAIRKIDAIYGVGWFDKNRQTFY